MVENDRDMLRQLYGMLVTELPYTREQRIEADDVSRRNNAMLRENQRRNANREARRVRGLRGGGDPVLFTPESLPQPNLDVFGPATVARSANAASNLLKSLGPKAGSLASSVMENLRKYAPAPVGAPASPAEALATGATAPAPVASPVQPTPAAAASPFALPQQSEVGAADVESAPPPTDETGMPVFPDDPLRLVDKYIYVNPDDQTTKTNYTAPTSDQFDIGTLEVLGPEIRNDRTASDLVVLRAKARNGDPNAEAAYNARVLPLIQHEWKKYDAAVAAKEAELQQKYDARKADNYDTQTKAQLMNAQTNRMVANAQVRQQTVSMVSSMLRGMGFGGDFGDAGFLQDLQMETVKSTTRTLQDQLKAVNESIADMKKNPLAQADPNFSASMRALESSRNRIQAELNKPITARRLPTGPTGADDADIAALTGIDGLNKATGRK